MERDRTEVRLPPTVQEQYRQDQARKHERQLRELQQLQSRPTPPETLFSGAIDIPEAPRPPSSTAESPAFDIAAAAAAAAAFASAPSYSVRF